MPAPRGYSYAVKKTGTPVWQTVSLFNPVVYLVSGFRWSFYGLADVSLALSLGMTLFFLVASLLVVTWMFRTGYRLKA